MSTEIPQVLTEETDQRFLTERFEVWRERIRALEQRLSADRVREIATIIALREAEIRRLQSRAEDLYMFHARRYLAQDLVGEADLVSLPPLEVTGIPGGRS